MTAPLYYFYPFGIDGSLTAVPQTTSDGTVSYQDGYGADYSLPIATNPSALPVERTKFNQIMFDATSNIQQLQQYSVPAFITTAANLGTPFSYSKGVRVLYTDGNIYESLVGSNTALPTVTANWKLVNSAGSQVIWGGTAGGTANALTFTPTIPITAYVAGTVFNGTVNTANTSGSVTINVSGLGTLTVLKSIGLSLVALAIGDLPAGADVSFLYDGTQAVLMNPRAYSKGAAIASASTVNLDTATGDYVQVTGTTTWTAITLSQGRQVATEMAGICTITNGSNLILPNSANITTAAGDVYVWRGEASGVVRLVGYCLASGKALVTTAGTAPQLQRAVIPSGGTWNTPTGTTTATIFKIYGVAGGCGGGGTGSGTFSSGGGGAGGCAGFAHATGYSAGSTWSIALGNGGAGGASGGSGSTGSSGGSTIVTDASSTVLLDLSGGNSTGGLGNSVSALNAVAGGSAVSGSFVADLIFAGEPGGVGIGLTTSYLVQGAGGGNGFGGGGSVGNVGVGSAGQSATSWGGGGSGASGASHAGGNGFQGVVWIEWVQ
jgi:hypothetical protein